VRGGIAQGVVASLRQEPKEVARPAEQLKSGANWDHWLPRPQRAEIIALPALSPFARLAIHNGRIMRNKIA
jgi:hypothetical protein